MNTRESLRQFVTEAIDLNERDRRSADYIKKTAAGTAALGGAALARQGAKTSGKAELIKSVAKSRKLKDTAKRLARKGRLRQLAGAGLALTGAGYLVKKAGSKKGPGGHVPDKTGPYGRGMGPGRGRGDGSGIR